MKKQLKPCMDVALRLLGQRAHSVGELSEKLAKKEYAPSEIHNVIQRLAELEYLDDASYAKGRVRYRREVSGWGPARIRQELMQKGVSADFIHAAFDVENSSDENQWLVRAQELLERKLKNKEVLDYAAQQKLVAFLVRRGFSLNIAKKAVELAHPLQR